MTFKFKFKTLGGHTHVGVYSGKNPNGTLGKNGNLVFRNEEWVEFVQALARTDLASAFVAQMAIRDCRCYEAAAHDSACEILELDRAVFLIEEEK